MDMEDWNWETMLTDIVDLSSTTVIYTASKAIEFDEKTQNKGDYAVQGHSRSSRLAPNAKSRMRLAISD